MGTLPCPIRPESYAGGRRMRSTTRVAICLWPLLIAQAPIGAVYGQEHGAGADSAELSLDRVLDAHEATVAAVQRVWAKAEMQVPRPGGGWKPVLWLEWARDGSIERFRTLRPDPENPEGRIVESDELFRGTQVWRRIRRIPGGAGQNAGLASAEEAYRYLIEPAAGRNLPHPNLPEALLLRLADPQGRFPGVTLRELVRAFAEKQGRVALSSAEKAVSISLIPKDATAAGIKKVEIELDPQAGYLVRKVVWHMPAADEGEPAHDWQYQLEVVRFDGDDAGAYLPVEVHSTNTATDPASHARLVVTELVLNEPLPNEALDFRIPAGTVVGYFDTPDGKPRIAVWGANNKPERFFSKLADFQRYLESQEAARAGGGSAFGTAAILGLLMAVLLWLAYRRRDRQDSRSGSAAGT